MSASRAPRRLRPVDLVRSIEAGQRMPFYLLFGEEDFERDRATAWLIGKLEPEVARDFNLDVFSADEVAARTVLDAYDAYPTMTSHRLIVLRRCELLSAQACQELAAMAESPMATSVFVAVGTKVDMRRRLFQRMAAMGQAVEFKTPYANQLPQWIRTQARRMAVDIDPDAADMLALLVGRNLRELASEIEKARTFVGQGGRITQEVVHQLAGAEGEANVFGLADALGSGDRKRGSLLMRKLIDDGEDPVRIVALLSRHFRLLLRARSALDHGLRSRDAMASALGVSPYFSSTYAEQARKQSPAQLWAAMTTLLEADSRVKSQSRRQCALALELLILELWPA